MHASGMAIELGAGSRPVEKLSLSREPDDILPEEVSSHSLKIIKRSQEIWMGRAADFMADPVEEPALLVFNILQPVPTKKQHKRQGLYRIIDAVV